MKEVNECIFIFLKENRNNMSKALKVYVINTYLHQNQYNDK